MDSSEGRYGDQIVKGKASSALNMQMKLRLSMPISFTEEGNDDHEYQYA